MLQRTQSKVVVLSLILSSPCFVHGAVSLKQNQRGGEQEDETISFHFPQHRVVVSKNLKAKKYTIKLPNELSRISEKAATRNTNTYDSSSDRSIEETTKTMKSTKSTLKILNASVPQISPIVNSGLALVALSSFIFTNHGYKALKELATGALSALALVWVPTLLFHGGWVELLGAATLFTLPNIRRFILRELSPKAFTTMKRLILSEAWRRIWMIVLAPLPKPLFVPSDHDIMRIHWLPDWLKQGFLYFRDKVDNFVLSTLKGSVQKSVYGTVGIFYDTVSNSMLEVSMIYEDAESLEGSAVIVDEDGNNDEQNDDDDDDDESDDHTPQLVCDGDSCRWE